MGQAILLETFRTVNSRTALSIASHNTETDAPPAQRYQTALALLYGKTGIMRSYTEFLDAVAMQARQPYAAKLPPLIPHDFLNQLMSDVYDHLRLKDVNMETQNGLLLVCLALHTYRLEHGRYPASLTELAPDYLKKIPYDPFALEGAFSYLLKGKSYVLYSVGPDGKDDGGTPIDDPKNARVGSPKRRYRVGRDSVGDIVAGVNTP